MLIAELNAKRIIRNAKHCNFDIETNNLKWHLPH